MVATEALISLAAARLRYLGKLKLVTIDNWAFSIHYRFTGIILLMMSLFITCNQFFGSPISCIKSNDIKIQIINSYCWIEGTFTLPKALIKDIELEQLGYIPSKAHPGIEQRHQDDIVITHSYYYWVCIVLFLQGLSFFVTHILWKVWEKGYMKLLISDLNKCILNDDVKLNSSFKSAQFLINYKFGFKNYSKKFFLCEVLNLINIILQILITNVFLDGQFLRYGWDMAFSKDLETDPTNKVFPKLGKCTFRRFGSSGDVQTYDNLCLLPINIVNEKFYFIIWILFFFVLTVSLWAVFVRIILMLIPGLRYSYIKMYNNCIHEELFQNILGNSDYSQWFVFYLLSQNLEPIHFREIVLFMNYYKEEKDLPKKLISNNLALYQSLNKNFLINFIEDEKKNGSNDKNSDNADDQILDGFSISNDATLKKK